MALKWRRPKKRGPSKAFDGKVRMRCPQCGKKVKFPSGMAGETFRCPVCGSIIVTPLDDKARQSPVVSVPQEEPDASAEAISQKSQSGQIQVVVEKAAIRNRAILELTQFLMKETQRTGSDVIEAL
ncbi:MAG: hypothetical protein ACTSWM_05935, partial [Alphaproteobacteria bacterium]